MLPIVTKWCRISFQPHVKIYTHRIAPWLNVVHIEYCCDMLWLTWWNSSSPRFENDNFLSALGHWKPPWRYLAETNFARVMAQCFDSWSQWVTESTATSARLCAWPTWEHLGGHPKWSHIASPVGSAVPVLSGYIIYWNHNYREL